MAEATAELVTIERPLWKDKVTLVSVQATEGEVGVLPGHQPLFSQLVNNGAVITNTADGKVFIASV